MNGTQNWERLLVEYTISVDIITYPVKVLSSTSCLAPHVSLFTGLSRAQ